MSTGLIVAVIVVVVILAVVVAVAMPRSRARRHEQDVTRRREAVAGAHREAAEERFARADLAERQANVERAQAELHASRAQLHEQGLADDELGAEPPMPTQRFTRERTDTPVGEPIAEREATRDA